MANTLALCQKQILSLNSQLIDSKIEPDEYRKSVEALLSGIGWQKRFLFDCLTFS